MLSLRESLSGYLGRARSVRCSAGQIAIQSGTWNPPGSTAPPPPPCAALQRETAPLEGFRNDAKLPSVRYVAEELGVSRNTVDKAYQQLYAEGYVVSRNRSGYYEERLA